MKKYILKVTYLSIVAVLAFSSSSVAVVLLEDTFVNSDTNGPFDIQDVNHPSTLEGLSGTYDKGTNTYFQAPWGVDGEGNPTPWSWQHQVRTTHELLLFWGQASVAENLNEGDSDGGFFVEVDINPARGALLSSGEWCGISIGASDPTNSIVFNGFSVIFRKSGTIQAWHYNVPLVVDSVTWNATPDDDYHTVKILATDAGDGNPFDGVGVTTFEIFVDGVGIYSNNLDGTVYSNNYVTLEGSGDNNYYDNLRVENFKIPDYYQIWINGYDVGSLTNRTDDVEPDGLNNFEEYVFGGNPTNDDASVVLPTGSLGEVGGSNVVVYTYRRRADDPNLTYGVLINDDLAAGTPVNMTNAYEVAPAGSTEDPDIESVTNHIPTAEAVKFISLEVTEE